MSSGDDGRAAVALRLAELLRSQNFVYEFAEVCARELVKGAHHLDEFKYRRTFKEFFDELFDHGNTEGAEFRVETYSGTEDLFVAIEAFEPLDGSELVRRKEPLRAVLRRCVNYANGADIRALYARKLREIADELDAGTIRGNELPLSAKCPTCGEWEAHAPSCSNQNAGKYFSSAAGNP